MHYVYVFGCVSVLLAELGLGTYMLHKHHNDRQNHRDCRL